MVVPMQAVRIIYIQLQSMMHAGLHITTASYCTYTLEISSYILPFDKLK